MFSTGQRKKAKIDKFGSLKNFKDVTVQIHVPEKGSHCHVTAALTEDVSDHDSIPTKCLSPYQLTLGINQ